MSTRSTQGDSKAEEAIGFALRNEPIPRIPDNFAQQLEKRAYAQLRLSLVNPLGGHIFGFLLTTPLIFALLWLLNKSATLANILQALPAELLLSVVVGSALVGLLDRFKNTSGSKWLR